jgi:hypothetical protein
MKTKNTIIGSILINNPFIRKYFINTNSNFIFTEPIISDINFLE